MSKDDITRAVDELAAKVERDAVERLTTAGKALGYLGFNDAELNEMQELIAGAARILAKGICTRSEADPLTRLMFRIHEGDRAKLQAISLLGQLGEMAAELSDLQSLYADTQMALVESDRECDRLREQVRELEEIIDAMKDR